MYQSMCSVATKKEVNGEGLKARSQQDLVSLFDGISILQMVTVD